MAKVRDRKSFGRYYLRKRKLLFIRHLQYCILSTFGSTCRKICPSWLNSNWIYRNKYDDMSKWGLLPAGSTIRMKRVKTLFFLMQYKTVKNIYSQEGLNTLESDLIFYCFSSSSPVRTVISCPHCCVYGHNAYVYWFQGNLLYRIISLILHWVKIKLFIKYCSCHAYKHYDHVFYMLRYCHIILKNLSS